MSPPEPQKVAIVTGADRGIGAGVSAAFRRDGYAVVGTSRSIGASDEPDFLTVRGDIAEADTSRRVVEQALDRFGRIDSLVNDAGIYIEKPFTEYTFEDYAAITAVNLTGFFHMTQRVIRQMAGQGGGHVNAVSLGVIRTPINDPASDERMAALHPLGRMGEISDVVDGILYLERATFVTGEVLHIDGGQVAGH